MHKRLTAPLPLSPWRRRGRSGVVALTAAAALGLLPAHVAWPHVAWAQGVPLQTAPLQTAPAQATPAQSTPAQSTPAQAASAGCADLTPEWGEVARVSPAGDLVLTDGTVLRLAGLAGGGAGAAVGWRPALAARVDGRAIAFAAGPERDRYGRRAALVRREGDDGTLQQQLLAQGLALARPEDGVLGCLPSWLDAEATARRDRRGLWRELPLDARDIGALRARQGRFTIVAGHILDVGKTNRVDYLNFGRVWRQDMTARVETEGRKALQSRGLDVSALAGRWVRLRGTVFEAGGPAITLRRAEQIDLAINRRGTWAGNGAEGRVRPTGDE